MESLDINSEVKSVLDQRANAIRAKLRAVLKATETWPHVRCGSVEVAREEGGAACGELCWRKRSDASWEVVWRNWGGKFCAPQALTTAPLWVACACLDPSGSSNPLLRLRSQVLASAAELTTKLDAILETPAPEIGCLAKPPRKLTRSKL